MDMARKSNREAILDAAEAVIRRQGLSSTTIEAVAIEAGVSKGGLFYHFASKSDLLLQLINRYQERFYEFRAEVMATLPDTPNRLIKATLIASIRHPGKMSSTAGNVIALLDDVRLRERIVEMKQIIFEEITANSKRPERVALAMLAADGLWMMDIFGNYYSPEFQERLVSELLHMVDILGASEGETCDEGDANRQG